VTRSNMLLITIEQRSSITFSQGPKAWKIGMVAGHRRETHLKKQNILLNCKANIISVDIENKYVRLVAFCF